MTVVILPGGEIVPALQRGVIDAGEFSDPSSDMAMGFQDVAKFYHLPGDAPAHRIHGNHRQQEQMGCPPGRT